jgi:hypothetical protein
MSAEKHHVVDDTPINPNESLLPMPLAWEIREVEHPHDPITVTIEVDGKSFDSMVPHLNARFLEEGMIALYNSVILRFKRAAP